MPISTSELDSAVKRPFCSQLNCQKIKRILNIEQASWKTVINKYIESQKPLVLDEK